jgi:chromosome segregation ATPase
MAGAALLLTACDGLTGNSRRQAEIDSLRVELSQRNAEMEDMLGTFNDISEGFRQINAAENRVELERGTVTENSLTAKQQIVSDIEFIQKQMAANKEQIAKLEDMLKNSKNNSAQLKRAVESLTKELAEKARRVEELTEELAAKNIRIQELGATVSDLTDDNERLTAENKTKEETVVTQDRMLNTAWFVFGTKKELKEQKILTDTGLFKKGKVLQDGDMNKDYFTKIDIRTTREIKLFSKDADILTTHPSGSYSLDKDSKGELVLKISDPVEFWKTSHYLVIQVK